MKCPTPDCDQKLREGHIFCSECWRLVTPDQREALRMCYRSPFYASTAWRMVDGSEEMRVESKAAAPSQPEFSRHKGVKAISEIMHLVEWQLLVGSIGKGIRKVRARKAARVRLAARRRAA